MSCRICDSSCCSASRPIPSPSFNAQTSEPAKAANLTPLRQGQEFDDTYFPDEEIADFKVYWALGRTDLSRNDAET